MKSILVIAVLLTGCASFSPDTEKSISKDDGKSNLPFHEFERIDVAVNSMGLYKSILEEIELENDPKVLKAFFAERLGQILEAIPDSIASAIDCSIKGLD